MQSTVPALIADLVETDSTAFDPPHGPIDLAKLAEIRADMARRGWQGAPLVVDGYQALTGSHRLAAMLALWNEDGIDVAADYVQIKDLCAAHGIDWDGLREEAGFGEAVLQVQELLPAEIVGYLGMDAG